MALASRHWYGYITILLVSIFIISNNNGGGGVDAVTTLSLAGAPYVTSSTLSATWKNDQSSTGATGAITITFNGTCYVSNVDSGASPWIIGTSQTNTNTYTINLNGEDLSANVTNWRSFSSARNNEDVLISGCWYNMIYSYIRNSNSAFSPTVPFFYDAKPSAPTWLAPLSGTTIGGTIPYSFKIARNVTGASRVTITFIDTITLGQQSISFGSSTSWIAGMINNGMLVTNNLRQSTGVASSDPTLPTLIDGRNYTLQLSYINSINQNSIVSNIWAIFDGATRAPVIIAPVSGEYAASVLVPYQFTFPEQPLPASITLTIQQSSISTANDVSAPYQLTLSSSCESTVGCSGTLNLTNLLATTNIVTSVSNGGTLLPYVSYDIILSYRDSFNNTAANATVTSFRLDVTGPSAPIIVSPVSNGVMGASIVFTYILTETAASGSITLNLSSPGDITSPHIITLQLSSYETNGSHSITLIGNDLQSSIGVKSVVSNGGNALITEVLYDISLFYSDISWNPSQVRTITSVRYDITPPLAPVVTAPLPSLTTGAKVFYSFVLAETPLVGSVTITFRESGSTNSDVNDPHILLLNGTCEAASTPCNGWISGTSLRQSANVVSVSSQAGNNDKLVTMVPYNITITYSDIAGNPSSTTIANYIMDITPPVVMPLAIASPTTNPIGYQYTLTETAAPSSVIITWSSGSDNNSPHILTLSNTTAGIHDGVILGNSLASSTGVVSATPLGSVLITDTTYSVTLTYSDIYGNTATSSSISVRYDITPPVAPSSISPSNDYTSNNPIPYSFTLASEVAQTGSVWISFTVDGSSTKVDANAPHIIKLSGVESIGVHSGTFIGTSLHTSVGVTSVSTQSGNNDVLVDGAIYNIAFGYNDIAGNPSATATSLRYRYDISPPSAAVITVPSADATSNSPISYSFTTFEQARAGSMIMTITRIDGRPDTNSPHTLTFTTASEVSGSHTGTLVVTSLSTSGNIASVAPTSPNDFLVTMATYNISITYQDLAGNAATSTVRGFLYDSIAPLSPLLIAPSSSSTKNALIPYSFTLNETALSSSVIMTFTESGTSLDALDPHIITFTSVCETSGNHIGNLTVPITPTSSINVASVSTSGILVNGAQYNVSLAYRDTARNLAITTNTAFVYDTTPPLSPLLIMPATQNSPISYNFTLFEKPLAGSVVMTFTRTSGSTDGNSPHTLVFASSMETIGSRVGTLIGSDLTQSSQLYQASVGGLVDGTTYDVTIYYRDLAGNLAATTKSFIYDITPPNIPVLAAPSSLSTSTNPIAYSYQTWEVAQSGSVTLTIQEAGTSLDANDPYILTFNSSGETSGIHTGVLIGTRLRSSTNVASVTSTGVLVDGARYNLTLSYRDIAGNGAAVTNYYFVYDITPPLVPTLTAPATSSTSTSPFLVQFQLYERALAGSVSLQFNEFGSALDTVYSPWTLSLSSTMETIGVHIIYINGMNLFQSRQDSTTGALGVVTNITAARAYTTPQLVSNSWYKVRVGYSDQAGNYAYTTNEAFIYDITPPTPPIINVPTVNGVSYQKWVPYDFTLSEVARAGSVTFTFTPVGATGVATSILTLNATRQTKDRHVATTTAGFKADSGSNGFLQSPFVVSVSGENQLYESVPSYNVNITYQDTAGNSASSVRYGYQFDITPPVAPVIFIPSINTVQTSPIPLQFDINEPSALITVTFTLNGASAVSDTNAPHTLYYNSSASYASGTKSFLVNGRKLSLSANVYQVSTQTGNKDVLVDGATYDISIIATDLAFNPSPAAVVTNFLYDITPPTVPILLGFTANATMGEYVVSSTQIFETPRANSVKLSFIRTSGPNDPNGPHVITLGGGVLTPNQLNQVLVYTTGFSDMGDAISISSCPNCYLNGGTIYTVRFEYADIAGNIAAINIIGVLADNVPPAAPLVYSPTVNGSYSDTNFIFNFTTLETGGAPLPAYAPVRILIEGTDCDKEQRFLYFNATYKPPGRRFFFFQPQNISLLPNLNVDQSGPLDSLRDGCPYSFSISLTDDAGNLGTVTVPLTYDNTPPVAPIIQSMRSGMRFTSPFPFAVTYSEVSLARSVILTLIRTGGEVDTRNHTITFNTTVDQTIGTINGTLRGTSLASSLYVFSSVNTPIGGADALVDGATYTLSLAVKDFASNAAITILTGVTYDITPPTTPLLAAPVNNTVVVAEPDDFLGENYQLKIDFTIYEQAAAGTCKMVFVPTSGSSITRTIVFSSSFHSAGQHSTIVDVTKIWSDNPIATGSANLDIDSTLSDDTLDDGTTYTVTFSYQDEATNRASATVYSLKLDLTPPLGATFGSGTVTIGSLTTTLLFGDVSSPPSYPTPIAYQITFPEVPKRGSANLLLISSDVTESHSIFLDVPTTGVFPLTFVSVLNVPLTSSPNILSVTSTDGGNNPIPSQLTIGTSYICTIVYSDVNSNISPQTDILNVEGGTAEFVYAEGAPAATFTLPLADTTYTNPFPVSYALPSFTSSFTYAKEVTLSFTNEDDASDVHILQFTSLAAIGGQSYSFNLSGATWENSTGYLLGPLPLPLSHGVSYTSQLSYLHPSNLFPVQFVTHTGFIYDIQTEGAVFSSPLSYASFRIFTITWTWLEAMTAGTMYMTIASDCNDGSGLRTVYLDNSYTSAGTHSLTLSTSVLSSSSGITSATGPESLTDGCAYTVTLYSKDHWGTNPMGNSSVHHVTYDAHTDPVTLLLPLSDTRFGSVPFQVAWTLSEPASRIIITITRTGGTADDTHSPHIITLKPIMNGDINGAIILSANQLSSSANVSSVSTYPNDQLVNNAIYTFEVSYEDSVGNAAQTSSVNNVECTSLVLSPVIRSPSGHFSFSRSFDFTYELFQDAPLDGAGVNIFGNDGSFTRLSFTSAACVTGVHTVSINGDSLLTGFNSLQGNGTLVNGVNYTIQLYATDVLYNPTVYISIYSVIYDIITLSPILSLPLSSTVYSTPLTIRYVLPETALPSSVLLSLTSSTSYHVLELTDITAGEHAISLNGPSLPSSSNVIVLVGSSSLESDSIYLVNLTYRDYLGNPPQSVVVTNVGYDNTTSNVIISTPSYDGVLVSSVVLSVDVPEIAAAGSMRVIFTRIDGTDDTHSPHILSLSDMYGSIGTWQLLLASTPGERLSSSISGGIVSSSSAPNDILVDGARYIISVEYQDTLLNPMAMTNRTIVYHYTTFPAVISSPIGNSMVSVPMAVNFTLPEEPFNQTNVSPKPLYIIFTRTGGNADLYAPHQCYLRDDVATIGFHSIDIINPIQSSSMILVCDRGVASALLDGVIYSVSIRYINSISNPEAITSVSSLTFDLITESPSVISPHGSTVNPIFVVHFSLPEVPLATSVTISFIATDDGNEVAHAIFATSTSGEHMITMNMIDLSASGNGASDAYISGSGSLVHLSMYEIGVSYRDYLGNPAAIAYGTIKYDAITEPLLLSLPMNDTIYNNDITIEFTLGEAASYVFAQFDDITANTSVRVYFNSLLNDWYSNNTLVVHSTVIIPSSLLSSPDVISMVSSSSSSSSSSLIDGHTYSLIIGYHDVYNNTAAVSSVIIHYDITTSPAIILLPLMDTSSLSSFVLSFTLPEVATNNTVTLTFTRTGGLSDESSPHVVKLAAMEARTYTYNDFSGVLAANTDITQIISGGTLVRGVVYTISLSYQDYLMNPITSVSTLRWSYWPLPPSITLPLIGDRTTSSIQLVWLTPSFTGLSNITQYRIHGGIRGGSMTINRNSSGTILTSGVYTGYHATTFSSLPANTSYIFYISALNSAGYGAEGNVSGMTYALSPSILTIVASDPSAVPDTAFGNGDVIDVTFDMNTNQPGVANRTQLDALLTYSSPLPNDYSGVWTTARRLRITMVNVLATDVAPTIGVWTMSVRATGGLLNDAATSLPSTSTSSALTGNWGTSLAGYAISLTDASITVPSDTIVTSLGISITSTSPTPVVLKLVLSVSPSGSGMINNTGALSSTITLIGLPALITIAAARLQFIPSSLYVGTTSMNMQLYNNDDSSLYSTQTLLISYTSVNHAPTVTGPSSMISLADTWLSLYDTIIINDVDATIAPSMPLQVTITVYGSIRITTIDADLDANVVANAPSTAPLILKGTLSVLQSALTYVQLSFDVLSDPPLSTLVVAIDDLDNGGDGSGTSLHAQLTTRVSIDCATALPSNVITARVTNTGAAIQLTLSLPIVVSSLTNGVSITCSSLLDATTLIAIGGSASICMYDSSTTIIIYPSSSWTLAIGDTITILPSSIARCGTWNGTTSAVNVPLLAPTYGISPIVAITGASQVSNCDGQTILLSTSLSNMGGRVPLSYQWFLPSPLTSSSSSYNQPSITLSSSDMSSGMSYIVSVLVTNWLGQSSNGTITITRLSTTSAPILTLSGSSVRTVAYGSVTRLRVVGNSNTCGGNTTSLRYGWMVVPNVSLPSNNNSTLVIPAGVLTAGVTYTFTVTASLAIDLSISSSLSVMVTQASASWYATIAGGSLRSVAQDRAIIIDASLSVPSSIGSGYSMTCHTLGGGVCTTTSYQSLVLSQSSLVQVIAASTLLTDTYIFTVTLGSEPASGNVISYSQTIIVTAAGTSTNVPVVTISGPSVMIPSSLVVLIGNVSSSSSSSLSYYWQVISSNSNINLNLDSSSITSSRRLSSLTLNVHRAAIFTPGVDYRFRLTVTDTIHSTSSVAEYMVHCNAAPIAGSITVSPSTGMAGVTEFAISTSNWIDIENNTPFTYTFFYYRTGTYDMIPLYSGNDAQTVTSKYISVGTTTLGVLITDSQGATSIATTSVNVTMPSAVTLTPAMMTQLLTDATNNGDNELTASITLTLFSLINYDSNNNDGMNDTLVGSYSDSEARELRRQLLLSLSSSATNVLPLMILRSLQSCVAIPSQVDNNMFVIVIHIINNLLATGDSSQANDAQVVPAYVDVEQHVLYGVQSTNTSSSSSLSNRRLLAATDSYSLLAITLTSISELFDSIGTMMIPSSSSSVVSLYNIETTSVSLSLQRQHMGDTSVITHVLHDINITIPSSSISSIDASQMVDWRIFVASPNPYITYDSHLLAPLTRVEVVSSTVLTSLYTNAPSILLPYDTSVCYDTSICNVACVSWDSSTSSWSTNGVTTDKTSSIVGYIVCRPARATATMSAAAIYPTSTGITGGSSSVISSSSSSSSSGSHVIIIDDDTSSSRVVSGMSNAAFFVVIFIVIAIVIAAAVYVYCRYYRPKPKKAIDHFGGGVPLSGNNGDSTSIDPYGDSGRAVSIPSQPIDIEMADMRASTTNQGEARISLV